jgi:RNase P subunit RPR2
MNCVDCKNVLKPHEERVSHEVRDHGRWVTVPQCDDCFWIERLSHATRDTVRCPPPVGAK